MLKFREVEINLQKRVQHPSHALIYLGLAKRKRILGKVRIELHLGAVAGHNSSFLARLLQLLRLIVAGLLLCLHIIPSSLELLTRSLEWRLSFACLGFTSLRAIKFYFIMKKLLKDGWQSSALFSPVPWRPWHAHQLPRKLSEQHPS